MPEERLKNVPVCYNRVIASPVKMASKLLWMLTFFLHL